MMISHVLQKSSITGEHLDKVRQAASAVATMENSSLANLPTELRDYIYDTALRFPEHIVLSERGLPLQHDMTQTALNLRLACRQLREESTPRLYAANTFSIAHNKGDASCEEILDQFLDRIGETNAKALQSVHISYTLTQGTLFNGEFRHHMRKLRMSSLRIPGCSVRVDLSFFDIYKSMLIQVQLDLRGIDASADKNAWIGNFQTNVASSLEESAEVQASISFLREHLRECRRDLERVGTSFDPGVGGVTRKAIYTFW